MRFRADPAAIRGSIAPLVTPFTADGDVDEAGLARIARWQLAHGSQGLSVGGSTGEPSSQSVAERISAMGVVAREAGDKVPFIPGTGTAKLDETIELTQAARDLGADAALVITPYYARPTQQALYEWYRTVAREVPDLPIVIYHVPMRTSVGIDPDTVARLFSDVENVVGIKETTKDFEHVSRVIHACGPDLMVWCGIELLCLPALTLGAAGFISALANIAPAAVRELFDAGDSGDLKVARRLHYELHPLVDSLFVETNPAPAKWLLHHMGLISSPHVRPPLIDLTAAGQERVRALAYQGRHLLPDAQEIPAGCPMAAPKPGESS